ncbi:MAG: hypothetical protein ABI632_04330 [Pseudolysinimonas sp.]
MSDDRDFDPRFDPAFQRGYEGIVDAPPKTPRAPASASIPAPPADPPAALTPTTTVDRREHLTPVPELDAARRANPFLITLLILSAGLIVGGLYLVVRMRDLFADTQSSTDFDFVTLQVLIPSAPIAIGLGVATAIGVLFVYAIRWGRSAE